MWRRNNHSSWIWIRSSFIRVALANRACRYFKCVNRSWHAKVIGCESEVLYRLLSFVTSALLTVLEIEHRMMSTLIKMDVFSVSIPFDYGPNHLPFKRRYLIHFQTLLKPTLDLSSIRYFEIVWRVYVGCDVTVWYIVSFCLLSCKIVLLDPHTK